MGVFMRDDAIRGAITWVKQQLVPRHAVSLDEFVNAPLFSGGLVITALQRLVEMAEIEALEPVSVAESTCAGFHPSTHFRLVRDSDHEHAWQREVPAETWPDPILQNLPAQVNVSTGVDDVSRWLWFNNSPIHI
jgi:hypothetical protein